MANNTLFITADYLKRNSQIQNNVDADLLQPIIVLVQDKFIEPVVGSELYSKLILDIQTNSLSGNYKSLLEVYIQPTIVQYCIAEGIYQIHNQVTNKGVLNKNSEYSEKAENESVTRMGDQALQNGNFYSERLIRYLRANYTLFPELNPTNANLATIFPQNNAYFSGINTPPGPNLGFRYRDGYNNDRGYSF